MTTARRFGFFLLAIACLAAYPAVAETVPDENEERFDLGGPCEEGSAPAGVHAKFREASLRGDRRGLIELHKQHVRAMCSNRHRWFSLAESYLNDARPGMAIEVLHELHRRGAEITPSTLEHQQKLLMLIDTPQFERSELGRELGKLRAKAARRKDDHRARLGALEPSARPPARYVAEGACPFECCSYREWDVLETTPLYDEKFGSAEVGSAVKGSRVRGVTGDVHVQPVPVAVVHDHPPFVRGEIVFVLDYIGEGLHRYWRDGTIGEDELWIDEYCLRPSRDCWAEQIESPEDRREPQWWILIETGEGVRGWTDRAKRFGNKDACG